MLAPILIGPHRIVPIMLAPMAGVTDAVFRNLCRTHGAGYAVAEMTHSKPQLREQKKSLTRRADPTEPAPRAIQLLGYDAALLADAARWHVDRGAQIIDLNLGCPAKKVCNVAAGSALMGRPDVVARIFEAVVSAVDVPVTVKMRTGTDAHHRNAVEIAHLAEDCGLQMVVVHGRTRAQKFQGEAEYDTIAAVKAAVSIPVIANGDIDSAEKARRVLEYTAADGVMIGRASCGNPWIFSELRAGLTGEVHWKKPSSRTVLETAAEHVAGLHRLYGEPAGVRIARKHFGWYLQRHLPHLAGARSRFNRLNDAGAQLALIESLIHEAA